MTVADALEARAVAARLSYQETMPVPSEIVEIVVVAVVVLAFAGFAAVWGVRPMFSTLARRDPALARAKWRGAAVVALVVISVLPSFHIASVDSARFHDTTGQVASLDVGSVGIDALFVTSLTVPAVIALLVFDALARRRAKRATPGADSVKLLTRAVQVDAVALALLVVLSGHYALFGLLVFAAALGP